MAQPDRLEGAPDAAVGVDGVERQLQPAAVSQRVAASTAAAEKRTSKATWRFLRRQLERAMLKRPDEARVLAAAVAACSGLNGSRHERTTATSRIRWVQHEQTQPRLGAAFSCTVSDPAFVVGMRSVPLIPSGIWKPSSMSVINCR
jgi:hypothetical protein